MGKKSDLQERLRGDKLATEITELLKMEPMRRALIEARALYNIYHFVAANLEDAGHHERAVQIGGMGEGVVRLSMTLAQYKIAAEAAREADPDTELVERRAQELYSSEVDWLTDDE